MKYLSPFIISFLLALMIGFIIIFFGKKVSFKRFGSRHIHSGNVPRLGGAAVILSFVFTILSNQSLVITRQMAVFIAASLMILLVGIWDDFRELSWKTQFFFQVLVVSIVCFVGVRVSYIVSPFGGVIDFSNGWLQIVGVVIAAVWILLLMNALNWIDGSDGLSGSTSMIAAFAIFALSLKPEVNQPPVAIMAVALTGALLGFLFLNVYPAKIMAGTSGSMFMGFSLGFLSVVAGTKMATTMLVLAVPIIDMMWVMTERISAGSSVFSADLRHIHHKMLKAGFSQRAIFLVFCLITSVAALIALNTGTMGKMYSIFSVGILILLSFFILRFKIAGYGDKNNNHVAK